MKYLYIIGLAYLAYRTFRPKPKLNTTYKEEIQEDPNAGFTDYDDEGFTDYEEIE
ncbi:hypothetical protein N9L92_00740 [Saprospiraceae bacterium]|nr:hypothetical protein [Saprospiraceae bacterium]